MKRKLLLILFCLAVTQCVSAKLFTATQDIRVKNGRRVHSPVLGVVKKGDTIDVQAINGSTWAKVKYKESDGFVKMTYLKPVPEAPAPPVEQVHKWNTTSFVLLMIGAIVLLFIARRLVEVAREYYENKANAKNKPAVVVQKPTHWYQCRHCRVTVKKHTAPSDNGCVSGKDHTWVELAEVGLNRYFCRNCATVITAKAIPVEAGCPSSDLHYWTQLS